MTPDKCPKCGASIALGEVGDGEQPCIMLGGYLYQCGTVAFGTSGAVDEDGPCLKTQRGQLAAENAALRESGKRLEEAVCVIGSALERMVSLYESEQDSEAPLVRPKWLSQALSVLRNIEATAQAKETYHEHT